MSDDAIHLTLSRADAKWLRWLINEAGSTEHCWRDNPFAADAYLTITDALDAALAADPAPEPGDALAATIAECEAKGWGWSVELVLASPPVYEATVLPGDFRRRRAEDGIAASALRAALDAALAAPAEGPERAAAGEGTPC